MKSLAEALGTADQSPQPEALRTSIGPLSTKFTARDFCRAIINSEEYRLSLMQRIVLGELPPAVECMIWDRAAGKVVERMEFEDKTLRLEDSPRVVLEQKVRQLNDLLEHLRMNDEMNAALSEADSEPPSVH